MTRRTLFLLLALLAAGGVSAYLFAPVFDDAKVFRPVDFMEYQTAGRATLNGENPYDGAVLYRYQLEIQAKLPDEFTGGPGDVTLYADPIMMWNPPWTLPLTLPLGAMHWRVGQLLWTAAQLLSVVVSGVLLWRVFGGANEKKVVAVGVAVLFAPTLFLLLLGQISGFLLLGVVGFLRFAPLSRRGRGVGGEGDEGRIPLTPNPSTGGVGGGGPPQGVGEGSFIAGLFAALTAIKPHLLLPFALLLALQTLRGGRTWRVVLAGGLALVLFGLMPMMWNPHVWSQYFEATAVAQSAGTHNTPSDWMHPTLGYWLRTLHPDRPMSLMFLPLLAAVPVVIGYWWVRRKDWNWATELPRVVLASLLTAPYGAWGFDLVLLLVPVVQAAVWVAKDSRKWVWLTFGGVFAAINLVALFTLRFENSMANGWLTPVVTVGYVLAASLCHRRELASDTGDSARKLAAMTTGAEALPS